MRKSIARDTFLLTMLLLTVKSVQAGEIHDAAKRGDLAKVKAILRQNPKLVNAKDKDGTTPLYVAASTGHTDMENFS